MQVYCSRARHHQLCTSSDVTTTNNIIEANSFAHTQLPARPLLYFYRGTEFRMRLNCLPSLIKSMPFNVASSFITVA